jgi:type VI secretion system secreted protein Hcp
MAIADYFLKLEGIDGESQDSKHKNEIEIHSWSWGAANKGTAAAGGGMGQGKVAMQDINFLKNIDKASAKLMLACASGQHIKSAILVGRKAGKEQQEYLKITLSDVLVSSIQHGHGTQQSYSFSGTGDQSPVPSGAAPPATESFSLNFTKIEFEYKEQKADGTLGGAIKTHWHVKENKGG